MHDRPPPSRVSQYRIVPRGAPAPARRWLPWVAGLAWLLSVGGAWQLSREQAAPGLGALERAHAELREAHRRATGQLAGVRQREATLARSDQISRAANDALQASLAERERRIAGLRRELAFYERLAGGASGAGLRVHSAEFAREPAGSWRYRIVLAQGERRKGKTAGALRFTVEGVRDGRLEAIDWEELHQSEAAPPQGYAFRYFQQLAGSVMLPDGFTPQRVRIRLHGEHGSREQTVAWSGIAATARGAF